MEKNMSKKLTLLAFVAITVFGSTSVYADVVGRCHALMAQSRRSPSQETIAARCACVAKHAKANTEKAVLAANEHCKDSGNK
jgi:hypothetical protein